MALAKKTGRPESEITGLEDGRRRRSSRLTEDTGLEMEEEEETRGRKSRREEEVGRCRLCWGAEVGVPPSRVSSLTDPSLSQADTAASSVPELERQIEKLAKVSGCGRAGGFSLSGGLQPPHHPPLSPQRQMFFRKKLLHSSQTLRAASLGQDRFRRRYWVLPHLGGIFVEGAEGEWGRGFWGVVAAGGGPHISPAAPPGCLSS